MTAAGTRSSSSSRTSSRYETGNAFGATSASPRASSPRCSDGRFTATRCSGCCLVDLRVVHVHRSNPRDAPPRFHAQQVAGGDRPRPERPGRDRARAREREAPVDPEPRRRRGVALVDGHACEGRPQVVEALARLRRHRHDLGARDELACLEDRELDALGVDRIDLRDRDDTTFDAQEAQHREVLVRLRPCALACVDRGRKRSIPDAPATIARTKRSWPGTSTSDSRRPSGNSSGA